jgi:hypothetical protein
VAQAKDLDPAEVEALREVARPGLLKKPIPAKVQERLIKMGYVEQKLGDLMATAKGKVYLAPPLKRRRRTWHPS